MFLNILQEESASLSTNTRWGSVHQYQEGKVRITHTTFLGYTKDENGDLKIVPNEAKIIERIYKEYLQGKSDTRIAKDLEKDGIKTPTGRKRWWKSYLVRSNQPPVLSLGAEVVTLGLSVGRGAIEPQSERVKL